ncbi:MAG: glycogen synthase [Buchananella hordeovulneris]|nr:glycogen synthase [Buchananella hordeovulneris]
MRVDLLTREYPPYVYGGAGVHVEELAKVLRPLIDVRVHAFDGEREGMEGVRGYSDPVELAGANAALKTLAVDLAMAGSVEGTDLVHSHTWYANMAGHWAHLLHDVPHVISAHSLEPLRPWKAEQLGGGYRVSSWAERTAYEGAARIIAVSGGMRQDILRAYPNLDPEKVEVIHNGIDLSDWNVPTPADEEFVAGVRQKWGIDPSRRAVVFVGRITRQKGLPHLLRAAEQLPDDVQLILCAGAPDTPEIKAEVESLVEGLRQQRSGVIWIAEKLPRAELIAVMTAANVFVTPSVYEPLGIVNLEAMAVHLPVVGTATGGIPEVIEDGKTGLLVPIEQVQDGTGTPVDPQGFENDLAAALVKVLDDPQRAREMGEAGRKRAEDHFAWTAIAQRTVDLYRRVLAGQ